MPDDGTSEMSKIEIASRFTSVDDLRKKAQKGEEKDRGEPQLVEIAQPQEERLISGIGEEVGEAVGERLGEFRDVLGTRFEEALETFGDQLGEVVDSFGEDTGKLVGELMATQAKVDSDISSYSSSLEGAIKGLEGKLDKLGEGDEEESGDIKKTLLGLTQAYGKQAELMEAQTPEPLRIPTAERMMSAAINHADDLIQRAREKLVDSNADPNDPETFRSAAYAENEIRDDLELLEGGKPEDVYRSRAYQQVVERWHESIVREMETSELAFEEQPERYSAITRAQALLEFKDETKPLAERLHKTFNARRLKKRMVRTWTLSTPDYLMTEASRFTTSVQQELFTYTEQDELSQFLGEEEDVDKKTPIASEFYEYEKKGKALDKAREEKDVAEEAYEEAKDKKDLSVDDKKKIEDKYNTAKQERKAKESEIKDYFEHGGKVVEGLDEEDKDDQHKREEYERIASELEKEVGDLYVDDAIAHLEDEKSREKEINEGLLDDLKRKLWARRSAGELWSITMRAGKYDVILNGTGDFFAGRVMNFGRKLQDRKMLHGTKGIWDPKSREIKGVGKAGEMLDLDMLDYFTEVLDQDLVLEENAVNGDWDDLGSEKFWEESKFSEVSDQHYSAVQIDNFGKADRTRKFHWGTNSFFHNPSMDKLGMYVREKMFDHVSSVKLVKSEYCEGKVTPRREKWAEMLDRTLQWMETPEAQRKLEDLKYFPAEKKKDFIEAAAVEEMISDEQRDHFYNKYFKVPALDELLKKTAVDKLLKKVPVLDRLLKGESKARAVVALNTMKGIYRKYGGYITMNMLGEMWKKFWAALLED